MFLFTLVVGAMNVSRLPAAMRPPLLTRLMLVWAAVLWGWFTAEQVSRVVLGRMGADAATTAEIAWHPVRIAVYATWAGSVLWFAWTVLGRQDASGSENLNDRSVKADDTAR